MDKRIKKAAIGVAAAGVIGGIIAYCSVTPQYDEDGNIIEMTTLEEITEETSETRAYDEATETTSQQLSTEITTYDRVNGHIVENVENLPVTPVDKCILYNNKELKLNLTMAEVKGILGNPLVFINEETETTTQQTETERPTEEQLIQSETATEAEALKNTAVHRYREFIIRTEIKNGSETVKDIEVISDKIKNAAGISPIDKEIFEITLSYGAPAYEDWNLCKYAIDETSYLYFKLREGKVDSWGIALY